jgi:hypothetical protein
MPKLNQPSRQSDIATAKGTRLPAAITPTVLPASTIANVKPRRAGSSLGDGHDRGPTSGTAYTRDGKKTLAVRIEDAYSIKKVPQPITAIKTASSIRTSYLSEIMPMTGERRV